MTGFDDMFGHEDVCDSYTPVEGLSRGLAGMVGRTAKTLEVARKAAQGYFCVNVVLDGDHTLTFDGKNWTLEIDTRGEYDYNAPFGEGYGEGWIVENWEIEEPNLDLPVRSGGRGEDIVLFHAEGWGLSEITKVSTRINVGVCHRCWGQIKDLPRQNEYANIPDEETDDTTFASFHRAGHWMKIIDADRKVLRAECDRAGCKACPNPAQVHVNPWAHLVGEYRRSWGGGWCKIIAAPNFPSPGKWNRPGSKVVEFDLDGDHKGRIRVHCTPIDEDGCQLNRPPHVDQKLCALTAKEAIERFLSEEDEVNAFWRREKELKKVLAVL